MTCLYNPARNSTVQGKRKRGRQRRRWEDYMTEWTGKPLDDDLRRAEERERWWASCRYSDAPVVT